MWYNINMKSCLICGGEYMPLRESQRFCGIACRNVYARSHFRPRVAKPAACRHCGAMTPTKGHTAPVCSACRTRPCEQCGTPFMSERLATRFCSRLCSTRWSAPRRLPLIGPLSPTWRGVARPYATHEWFVVRDFVRERDGWRCVDCGKERTKARRVMAHHLVSRADWGDRPGHADDAVNLVTVCHICHRTRHAMAPEVLRTRRQEQRRVYYATHRDAIDAKSREWALANPARVRDIKRRSAALHPRHADIGQST